MKEKFLNKCMISVKEKYPEYDQDKLDEIAYGIEVVYITLTKTSVLFIFAFIFNVFKEVALLLLFYGVLRTTAFGMHAKKSWQCYVISITLFVGGGILCRYVDINIYVKFVLAVIGFIFIILYAPADTYKRPLINAKRRRIYKIITSSISLIYLIFIFIFRNYDISNILLVGLWDAVLMIHPITYRVFQLPYNNYKTYNESSN